MSRVGRTLIATLAAMTIAAAAILSASATNAPPPGDAAEYALQWNLRAIHAKAAWDMGELGSRGVAVAVLDTGIDTQHPDLVGVVDLERSRSFLSSSPSSCPAGEPGTPSGVAEDATATTRGLPLVTDFHSHGTAVSGLISSNAVVLAGVTQRIKLFGVKVHDRVRRNCLTVYLAAVEYAADAGADVIHMSFPLEFSKAAFPGAAEQVDETMEYAHRKGAILVAAAGNNNQEVDAASDVFRFCAAKHVICVSSTGPLNAAGLLAGDWDHASDFTNYGPAIDVAGPGGTGTFPTQVVPVWLACSRVTLVTNPAQAPSQCRTAPNLIWGSTGTSFGAAATSGLLALLVDRIGKNRPDEVAEALKDSVEDLVPTGWDPYFGYGRIDVAKALALPAP